ncbi:MAG: tetratricopeptide repeat protein, partial [Planctomyces sp.]
MRHLALTGLMATLLAGCGGSDKGDAAAKTAGIPLAIASAKQSETPVKVTKKLDEYPAEIRALLQRANAAVVAGRNAVAIESLCQAIGQTPEDASLFRMRADVYKLQGENASARADFSTALRLAPNDPDLWNNRGYFLMSQGLTAEALSDFNRAIQLQPAHSAALNNRGLVHLANQKMEDAEADFTKAIDADQKFVDAWNNRAFARLKLNRLAPAMDDIRQALRLDERYATAWNNCGLIAVRQENWEEAVRAFSRAIELEPLDSRWLGHRREALLKLGRYEESQADAARVLWLEELKRLSAAAQQSPRGTEVWLQRGSHLMAGREFGAAAQDFTRVLLLQPKNADALAARARAWVAMGDRDRAMADCDSCLAIRADKDALSLRGDLWLQREDPERALADYEAAERFDEQVAQAYD